MGEAALKFEDLHEYDWKNHYMVPNEEKLHWYELVKNIPLHRVAGICSSGEVGLVSLLPVARKELVLVDHSYQSLAVAMVKYIILRVHGPKEAARLFTTGGEALDTAVKAAVAELPEKVKQVYDDYEGVDRMGRLSPWRWDTPTLRSEWDKRAVPSRLLKKSYDKLDKVTFLHGDLSDLEARGPFDLVYISNALNHSNRDQQMPTHKQVEKVVKPGGYVIAAEFSGYEYYLKNYRGEWKSVRAVKTAYRPREGFKRASRGQLDWVHVLYQLPA